MDDLLIGCDNDIEVTLTTRATGVTVDDATVTADIETVGGTSIETDIACEFVADGLYRGVVPAATTADLVPDRQYVVIFSNGGGVVARVTVVARHYEV